MSWRSFSACPVSWTNHLIVDAQIGMVLKDIEILICNQSKTINDRINKNNIYMAFCTVTLNISESSCDVMCDSNTNSKRKYQ